MLRSGRMLQNNWCPYPFHYTMTTPDMIVRPCCRYDSNNDIEDLKIASYKNLNHTFSGKTFNQLRSMFEGNLRPTGCSTCFREEDAGVLSLRQKSILEKSLPSTNDISLYGIEIGVGRLCNLKCRTCNSQYSSKWDADEMALGITTQSLTAKTSVDLDQFPDELFKDLKDVKITGGEPFLSPPFEKFLERFVQSGHASSCTIEVFSNCSFIPKQAFLDHLKHFKSTRLSLSIDGLEDKNEYIRHPSDWRKILETLHFWKQWTQQNSKNRVWIAHTLCIFNIADVFDFMLWAENFWGSQAKIVLQILHGPPHLSIFNTPVKFKSLVMDHLNKQLQDSHKQLDSEKNKNNKNKIFNILKDSTTSSSLQDFLIQTQKLDELRNESFKKTFPLLSDWVHACLD
jgi:molybdenum cofactor biosynthesis enzyme MoaA